MLTRVENGFRNAPPVTEMLRTDPDPETMLRTVLSGFQPEILERVPVEYRCDCSRKRMEAALIAMGKRELRSLLEEQGGAELGCRFCGEVRKFTREDLERLLETM